MEDNLLSTETIPEAIANAEYIKENLPTEEPQSMDGEVFDSTAESSPEATIVEPTKTNEEGVPYHLLGIEPPDENDPGRQLVESLDKPPEEYGPTENFLEGSMAVAQGILGSVESIATVAPRYKDMVSGKDPGDPNYEPAWSPFSVRHPVLKTKWAPIFENIAHYSTLGAILLRTGVSNPMALAGATAAVSNKSQQPDSDILGSLRSLIPQLNDVPVLNSVVNTFAVNDQDHPLLKTAKNVLQDIGMAKAIDDIFKSLYKNDPKYLEFEAQQTANVNRQIEEMAIEQVKVQDLGPTPPRALPGQGDQPLLPPSDFGGYKNKPIADITQGNANPTNTPSNVLKQLNQIDAEDLGGGTTDPIFTRAQVRRMADNNGMSPAEMRDIAQDLLSNENYRSLVDEAYESRRSVSEVFAPSFRRFQQIIGHDATKLPPEEFYKLVLDDARMATGEGPASPNLTAISTENVVVIDLVTSHLFKQAQTHAKSLREIMSWGDIWAVDGPMSGLRDNLVFGLGQARRARKLASYNMLKLRQSKNPLKTSTRDLDPDLMAKELDDVFEETRTNIDFFFEMVEEMDDPELNSTILDIFASSENTRNWMDIEAYMRKKVRGGDLNGKHNPGQLVRELNAVWTNSALNSVKTPQRAFTGTAQFSFYRTISRFFGQKTRQAMSFGKDIDPINQAEATGELIAYFEHLPDAWNIFYKKVRNNFSKQSGTYDNRFQRYSSEEFNWKFGDKFYKDMKRGDFMDRRFYDISKSGWWLNSRRIFTATNRVLAPIDDAFRYVQAKQRSRALAIRNAMQEVQKGNFTELTPEILKQADDMYFNNLLDGEGNIDIFKDSYLQNIIQEDTLTTPLEGFPKSLQKSLNESTNPVAPFTSRFVAFATPGWNDLTMNFRNFPIVGAFHNKSRRILTATPDNFVEKVGRYGIKSLRDLEAAKDTIIGAQMISTFVVGAYILNGFINDNKGPGSVDPKQKSVQRKLGRKDNYEYFGSVGIPSNILQTHWLLKTSIGLIIDNSNKMGAEWTDQAILKFGTAIASVATDSSMLSQINELINFASGDPDASAGRVLGSQLNTQFPGGGTRNDIGNVLDPALKEVNADLISTIRNRNKFLGKIDDPLTGVPGEPLPSKKNILNGKDINDQPLLVKLFNAVSAYPIDIGGNSKALEAIERSNLDLSMATWSTPDGDSLQDYPDIRSAYQQAIGEWRDSKTGLSLEDKILEIYNRPRTQRDIAKMESEVGLIPKVMGAFGNKVAQENIGRDPSFYPHNVAYKNLFNQVKSEAWATLRDRDDVKELKEKSKEERQRNIKLNLDSMYNRNVDKLKPVLDLNN